MNSLAFSIGFPTPKTIKPNTSYNPREKLNSSDFEKAALTGSEHTTSGPLTTTSPPLNERWKLLGRRELLLCNGAYISIIASVLLQCQYAEASCQFTTSPSGLAFCDQIVGTGPQAQKGQLIKAHYIGKLENGKVFDSSYNRGKPLTFRVGVGEVIKGWDQGIVGSEGVPPMLAGGKRSLKIPPELGYGMRGAGCKGGTCIIPPNSTLYFDVEYVGNV